MRELVLKNQGLETKLIGAESFDVKGTFETVSFSCGKRKIGQFRRHEKKWKTLKNNSTDGNPFTERNRDREEPKSESEQRFWCQKLKFRES